MEKGYNRFLTIFSIIIGIALLVVIGYFIYDLIQKYFVNKDAEDFIADYEQQVKQDVEQEQEQGEQTSETGTTENGNGSQTGSKKKKSRTYTYKGFDVCGMIEIPKTKVKYPIISKMSKEAIETAVAVEYGPGPNQPGNTVISGHNYRNGLFFSKNKRLNNGDIVYITDNSGRRMKYTIYNKYETSQMDTAYMTRQTDGRTEITLATCNDNSKARLILWAKLDE